MTRYSTGTWFMVCCTMFMSMLLAGCSQGEQATGGKKTYSVRGEIVQMPGADSVDKAMLIRHEAIPDFAGADGKVVGMMAMTMPFPIAEGVSLEGLKVGDAVAFTFDMNWGAPKGADPYSVTKIEKLPEGTKLELGMPRTPAMNHDHPTGEDAHSHK